MNIRSDIEREKQHLLIEKPLAVAHPDGSVSPTGHSSVGEGEEARGEEACLVRWMADI